MLGIAVRLLILAAWLALSGWHVADRLLPAWGLVPASDPASVLAERVGTVQHYAIHWRGSDGGERRIGQCLSSAIADDIGLRLETALEVTDTRGIPAERWLRRALGGRGRHGIRLHLASQLDARLRLRRVEGEGSLFGLAVRGEGEVDGRGLRLRWQAGEASGELLLPEIRPELLAGSDLGFGLPRGLRPGQRFTQRLATIDYLQLRPRLGEAVFSVRGREALATAAGELPLLVVDMELDGRRFATLWADERGIVYRQQLVELPLALSLLRITDSFGQQRWPATTL
ncbi:MAG: hypothetical protein RMM29_09255 [Planctomycetota bacterium]|nr:hypothetical protein [Planctomycetota bacterium]MCX8039575.1 hypothetical protein [Planctomycetota bacterium]MDW8373815.1 hypothetical protein [Planctomycetota bacterium]